MVRGTLMALGAAAAALLVWFVVSAEEEEELSYPASELCEICCENAEDFHDGRNSFGMCLECGKMFCGPCRRKLMILEHQKRAESGLPPAAHITCPFCRANTEGSAARYLMCQRLLENRPTSSCLRHCHFEMGLIRTMGLNVPKDDAAALVHLRAAAALGHGAAMYWIGGFYEDGIGVEKDESEAMRWYRRGKAVGDPNATGNVNSESTRMLNRMAREQNRAYVAERVWAQTPPELADRGLTYY